MPAATSNVDELALKVALARLVPEAVIVDFDGPPELREYGFFWNEGAGEVAVTDREWLAVVALCEVGLSEDQQADFLDELMKLVLGSTLPLAWVTTSQWFLLVSATWQQRATALLTVKGLLP